MVAYNNFKVFWDFGNFWRFFGDFLGIFGGFLNEVLGFSKSLGETFFDRFFFCFE